MRVTLAAYSKIQVHIKAFDAFGNPTTAGRLKVRSSDERIAKFRRGWLISTGKKFGWVRLITKLPDGATITSDPIWVSKKRLEEELVK